MQTLTRYKEIVIPVDSIHLKGNLRIAKDSKGIILFSHGSGSSRMSSRNNFVADLLLKGGFSSLLFDLLTEQEDRIYEKRFDIELLTERLVKVTNWIRTDKDLKKLPIGYFGASTGAASALCAAAQLGNTIKAIVSRGGRPDLAMHDLKHINIPTLLLVGSDDVAVIELNKRAKSEIKGICVLQLIDGATHLFVEPGKLEEVAKNTNAWFNKYLKE
jgi:pimeloyl-ACP methyl ester carboxylesterase